MNKKINVEFIKSFNPCRKGIVNFEKYHSNFNGSLEKLLKLDNIPYTDKIWLVAKIVNYKILQQWSLDCATFIVDNYNKEHPNDNRINDCLEKTRLFLLGETTEEELSAAESTARSAAWSAAWSARSAAWSAESAAWSAAESAVCSARSAVRSAAESARSAAESGKEQEDINLSLLIALL